MILWPFGSTAIDGAASALWYPITHASESMCRYFSKTEAAVYVCQILGMGGVITCYDAVHTGCLIKQDHTSVSGFGNCTLS